jgi:hypothetical protein
MVTTDGQDQITVWADENNHDDDNDDTRYGDGTAVTGRATTEGADGGSGTTNFNLRVEQNKIPEFFGTKSKDTISAAHFIRLLEGLAKTYRWTDA